jgi:hypothetical protein
VLGLRVGQETGPQEHRVLAIRRVSRSDRSDNRDSALR